jgi:type VI protein secretion system component Hcp
MSIKYTTLLNEYISENQKLKKEIETLKSDIQNLKDYIKYTL